MRVSARIMTGLAAEAPDNTTISIDATYLKAHRTALRLRSNKGAWQADWADERRAKTHQIRQAPLQTA